jgi:hypothetical protein
MPRARGDIALDPFLGSGSTLIAADATGRIIESTARAFRNGVAITRPEMTAWQEFLLDTGAIQHPRDPDAYYSDEAH